MSIKFACPYCDKVSSVPDSFAGKKGKCPACKKVIEVPDPSGEGGGAKDSGDDIELVESTDDRGESGGSGGGGGSGEKACPFCGETIKAVAKKCKYCGEFLERGGRKKRRAGGRSGPKPQNHLVLAIIATVVCGCLPVGIFAIINASKVDSLWASGDARGAREASRKAKSLSFWSMGLAFAWVILWVGFSILAGM